MAGKINKKYFDVLEMRFCVVLSFFKQTLSTVYNIHNPLLNICKI